MDSVKHFLLLTLKITKIKWFLVYAQNGVYAFDHLGPSICTIKYINFLLPPRPDNPMDM